MLFFSENIVNSPLLWHVSVWRWKKLNRVDLLCFFKVDSAVLGQRNVDERARDRIAAITAIATKHQKDLAAVYSSSGTNERMCLQSFIFKSIKHMHVDECRSENMIYLNFHRRLRYTHTLQKILELIHSQFWMWKPATSDHHRGFP